MKQTIVIDGEEYIKKSTIQEKTKKELLDRYTYLHDDHVMLRYGCVLCLIAPRVDGDYV
jgi:hypothetical protein